tara:strand:- start:1333 stop:1845 length:513 start_codon:yes stop_codon:yes gene_type:complete
MTKSMAQMADEILGGALTDPAKNPHEPSVGHQSHLPAMDPNDTLMEMNDSQRALLMGLAAPAIKETVIEEAAAEEKVEPTPSGWGSPTTSLELSPQDLETLSEAVSKRIIEKIEEMTSVGNIGVNMAGGAKGDPKSITLPGDPKKSPKKRTKKKVKTEAASSDFLSYLKA